MPRRINSNGRRSRPRNRNSRRRYNAPTRNDNDTKFKARNQVQYILPRQFRIVPPSMVTRLVFQSTQHNPLNNVGLTYASVRFRPSSAYDVDPTIGGTSMPGFNEYAALYGKYRVLAFKIDVFFNNLEDFPLYCIVFMSNFDLGNNYSQVQSQFGNTFTKFSTVSAKGGQDRTRLSLGWLKHTTYVGNDVPLTDDDYAANTNTSPVNNVYFNVAIWTGNTTLLTVGASVLIVISSEVRFTETLHNITLPDPPELHPELEEPDDDSEYTKTSPTKLSRDNARGSSIYPKSNYELPHSKDRIGSASVPVMGVSGSPLCEQTDLSEDESRMISRLSVEDKDDIVRIYLRSSNYEARTKKESLSNGPNK